MKVVKFVRSMYRAGRIAQITFDNHGIDIRENLNAMMFVQNMLLVSKLTNEEIVTELMEIIADLPELVSGN